MHARLFFRFGPGVPSMVSFFYRWGILLLPGVLLLFASLRCTEDRHRLVLWMGTAFQLLVCLLAFISRQDPRQSVGPSLVTLYVIALSWLWLGAANRNDWFFHLSQAILLVVPLLCFSWQILTDSGVPLMRRARLLADHLAARKDWPSDLNACRTLPEVKAFRDTLHLDAAPALALLGHARAEVRIAALAALEFRQNWQPGQAEIVLQLAQRAPEPAIRAAAVTVLGNIDNQVLIETLAEFLRDPSWEVRRAATEALLWDTEHRWAWIRHAVRRALLDPLAANDGPLRHNGKLLTTEAVADLTAWAAEKGTLGQRAALTLGVYYHRALSEEQSPALPRELRQQLANPHTPAMLRLELARLLQNSQELTFDVLESLLDAASPAPLRLLAVESILVNQGDHVEARSALCELARLPNREIALATANVVQHRLGVDLGLALNEPLPPIHSRQAAEVTRRVMLWAAAQQEQSPVPGSLQPLLTRRGSSREGSLD